MLCQCAPIFRAVTGDGSNLTFSMTGDGVVDVHVKTPGTNIVSIQGAPAASLNGDDLSLTFNDGRAGGLRDLTTGHPGPA